MDSKTLRSLMDSLKSRLADAVLVLAGRDGDKVALIAAVGSSYSSNIKAGAIISHLAAQLGGKGGGKPDLAQGGAPFSDAYPSVMQALPTWIAEQLN